ncbi:putative P(E)-nerolidol/(E,E)-geranyl linalool synthase [Hibiscus syriacus]|uniref:P(E)-nerolidol/(E,E)-geranyl linalool synthase n=1 Tax=Hibiscus syriacus TaxID=106335 RepID=A0A6A3AWY2_HIBSY|nr:putative P(E)-nerolidol/(E,E)-geranyl linalool synthase [Hibiscus syriacus]
MATGNKDCLAYLQSLVETCSNSGVPPTCPVDEELVKLGLANQMQRLGLAEQFTWQIEDILTKVYKATDLIFPGEYELEEARSFSRKVLEKVGSKGTGSDNDPLTKSFNFQTMIEHELSLPWVARLDHLEHRALSLPYDSDIRMVVAKSGILITVADDFFDTEGSLEELNILTDAVRRWYARGLSGHSKVIFDALDNLAKETAANHQQQNGTDITCFLKQIVSGLTKYWPFPARTETMLRVVLLANTNTDEYLRNGMTSVAAYTLALPASCFLKSSLRNADIILVTRLLNDIQSYQKEIEDGKMNYVLLYMKENPDADIDDSIAFIRDLLENKRKELMKHALMDGLSDLPLASRQLHLSCLKVFQMFYNSDMLKM